jgi:hypothetical protein
VTETSCNARALPDWVRVLDPLGDGQNATTAYFWHATLDQPTRVTSLLGQGACPELHEPTPAGMLARAGPVER